MGAQHGATARVFLTMRRRSGAGKVVPMSDATGAPENAQTDAQTDPFTEGAVIPKRKRAGSTTALPAGFVEAALGKLGDSPNPGATLVANQPAPTRSDAGNIAFQLREALADRGIFTRTATWQVADPPVMLLDDKGKPSRRQDPKVPYFWGLTVVRREDFSDTTGKRAEQA